jgi:hypothetical protein
LTTGACDIARLMFAVQPILALGFLAGGTARWLAWIASAAATLVIIVYEWRSRWKHLEVARRTKPARLPLLLDLEQTRSVLGFWPSLPLLLLKTANGYALNLASVPVRIAGLYFAGFAGLWLWLVR